MLDLPPCHALPYYAFSIISAFIFHCAYTLLFSHCFAAAISSSLFFAIYAIIDAIISLPPNDFLTLLPLRFR